MRVLLDENLPRKLKHRLSPEHDAMTVKEREWSGLLNGALLRAAGEEFDAFLTLDRGIEYQQNLTGFSLRVIVIRAFSNKYEELLPLVPSIHAALSRVRSSMCRAKPPLSEMKEDNRFHAVLTRHGAV